MAFAITPIGDAQTADAPEAIPVVEGLNAAVAMDFAPDGTIWIAELSGNVSRIDPATGGIESVQQLAVVTGGERGLLGLGLAADFEDTGAYYLYYTTATEDGEINRLVRVQDDTEAVLATIPAAEQHNGGRILVAPDGSLFVGTGENLLRDPAQDPDSLLGKILHMSADGEPMEGNLNGLVHSKGHRNVFGLAMHPETGELWATENSGWRRDEVNRIEAGGNYGYPECEGRGLNGVDDPCPEDKGYIFPVMTFYEDRAAAPTGAAFWDGDFHWASLNEGTIHRIHQAPDGSWQDTVVLEAGGPVLDLAVGPQGALHFITFDGLWRVEGTTSLDPEPEAYAGGGLSTGVVVGLLACLLLVWLRRG